MRGELISVGTELLLGQIPDTNAQYLAQRLAELGIDLYYQSTVGDNPERLARALRVSLERSDLIIATGGLGPTQDDITAAAIAAVTGEELVVSEEAASWIRELFQRRGWPLSESQLKQALVPRGGRLVPNRLGTAPGFILEKEGKVVVALPGVPSEMQAMAEAEVFPYLRQRAGGSGVIKSRVLKFFGLPESFLEKELEDLIAAQTNPTIAPQAKLGEVWLRITAKAAEPAAADRLIAGTEERIQERLGQYLVATDEKQIEEVVGRLLREAGLTLAVAESCTGGLISHRLTNVPGSSQYFLCGLTCYSNGAKTHLLGVSETTLRAHGAVSAEAAKEMAIGVRAACDAALGLAVTGIAGPGGGTPEKPVGLVYLALAGPEGIRGERHFFPGDREGIKQRASQAALRLLWERAKQEVQGRAACGRR